MCFMSQMWIQLILDPWWTFCSTAMHFETLYVSLLNHQGVSLPFHVKVAHISCVLCSTFLISSSTSAPVTFMPTFPLSLSLFGFACLLNLFGSVVVLVLSALVMTMVLWLLVGSDWETYLALLLHSQYDSRSVRWMLRGLFRTGTAYRYSEQYQG